jgi:hypothetical protein
MLMSLPVMAQQYTTVTVEGFATPLKVEIKGMQVAIPVQCDEKFCESDDLNCDGVLDQTCPGLEYDICTDGSIVESYIEAAFTGFCVEEVEVEELVCGGLVISPSIPDPRCDD